MRISSPPYSYNLLNKSSFPSQPPLQVQFKKQELNLARHLLGSTARNWMFKSEKSECVGSKRARESH